VDPIDRYQRWAAYLDAALTARDWTPAEYARRHGGGLSPSVVSRWRNPGSRLAPSPEVALRVADTLGEKPARVLHEAGYDTLAARLADAGPAAASLMHPVVDETVAMIRDSGLPQGAQESLRETFDTELDGDLGLLKSLIERKITKLLRELELGESILNGEDDDDSQHTA
jgi:hypothetical protein